MIAQLEKKVNRNFGKIFGIKLYKFRAGEVCARIFIRLRVFESERDNR